MHARRDRHDTASSALETASAAAGTTRIDQRCPFQSSASASPSGFLNDPTATHTDREGHRRREESAGRQAWQRDRLGGPRHSRAVAVVPTKTATMIEQQTHRPSLDMTRCPPWPDRTLTPVLSQPATTIRSHSITRHDLVCDRPGRADCCHAPPSRPTAIQRDPSTPRSSSRAEPVIAAVATSNTFSHHLSSASMSSILTLARKGLSCMEAGARSLWQSLWASSSWRPLV